MDTVHWPAIAGDRSTGGERPSRPDDGIPSAAARQLWGIPGTPGVAQGRVRHVAGLADAADVEPGEVVVCNALTLGIASHFVRVEAVIAESGSANCAGMKFLRDSDVPSVVYPGARECLRPGQWVVVDGARGAVWIGARLASPAETTK